MEIVQTTGLRKYKKDKDKSKKSELRDRSTIGKCGIAAGRGEANRYSFDFTKHLQIPPVF